MNIVVVESPSKAKTINKYLGSDYEVLASFGHIRDLPPKDGSVDPDNDFHMMRSAARLAYQQAQLAIGGRIDEDTQPLVEPVLRPLYAAYEVMKRARAERQPLDLDLPERKILLKADGTVDRVITPERLEAHRLIEEFMFLKDLLKLLRRHQPGHRPSTVLLN